MRIKMRTKGNQSTTTPKNPISDWLDNESLVTSSGLSRLLRGQTHFKKQKLIFFQIPILLPDRPPTISGFYCCMIFSSSTLSLFIHVN